MDGCCEKECWCYVRVWASKLWLRMSINTLRVRLSVCSMGTIFSPETTTAVSLVLSWYGGLRVIVKENRTRTLRLELRLFTTILRTGWLICQRSTLVASRLTQRMSLGLKSRRNALTLDPSIRSQFLRIDPGASLRFSSPSSIARWRNKDRRKRFAIDVLFFLRFTPIESTERIGTERRTMCEDNVAYLSIGSFAG